MDENINLQEMQQNNDLYFDVNIPEQIFQAIDIIVKKRLEQLPYDQTIEGKIIANDRALFGEYTVKTKSDLIFKAYSDNVGYPLYQKVYINIPQGDYSKQKIITGPIIPENSEYLLGTPTTYEELFGSPFSDIEWNLVDGKQTNNTIIPGVSEEQKKDMLNQYLESCKTYTNNYIQRFSENKEFYLNALQEYLKQSGDLTVDEKTGKVIFKNPANTSILPTWNGGGFWANGAANPTYKWAESYLYNYKNQIESAKEQWLAFLSKNRELKE